MNFLASILTTASTVTRIATKIINAFNVETDDSNGNASAESFKTGIVQWANIEDRGRVAMNDSDHTALCSFHQEVTSAEGDFYHESVLVKVEKGFGVNVEDDFRVFGERGNVSVAPEDAPSTGDSKDSALRQATFFVPSLASSRFTALGGNIQFERGTRIANDEQVNFWKITSDTPLINAQLSYHEPLGGTIDFRVALNDNRQENGRHEYEIPMDKDSSVEGILSNFLVVLEMTSASLETFLAPRESFSLSALPEGIRAALART